MVDFEIDEDGQRQPRNSLGKSDNYALRWKPRTEVKPKETEEEYHLRETERKKKIPETIKAMKKTKKKQDDFDDFAESYYDNVEAKNGFSGLITKPTRFLVGEDGAEFVSVTPHKKNRPIMDLGLEMMNNTRLPRKKGKNLDFNFDMGNIMGGSSKKKKKSANPFDFNLF